MTRANRAGAGPEPGLPSPENAIGRPDAKSAVGSLVDAQLMSPSEDLVLHGGAGSELVLEERRDEGDELEHAEMLHWWAP